MSRALNLEIPYNKSTIGTNLVFHTRFITYSCFFFCQWNQPAHWYCYYAKSQQMLLYIMNTIPYLTNFQIGTIHQTRFQWWVEILLILNHSILETFNTDKTTRQETTHDCLTYARMNAKHSFSFFGWRSRRSSRAISSSHCPKSIFFGIG